jgi:hypothetical protein
LEILLKNFSLSAQNGKYTKNNNRFLNMKIHLLRTRK